LPKTANYQWQLQCTCEWKQHALVTLICRVRPWQHVIIPYKPRSRV
jgi:hypothetical protein